MFTIRKTAKRPGLTSRLDRAAREDLLQSGTEVRYAEGRVIHRQGDADRSLQVILEGQVAISRLDEDGEEVLATVLEAGDTFGEIPMLTGRTRTHDAVAATPVRLLRISQAKFSALLDRQPSIRNHLLAGLAEMLAQALDELDSAQRLTVPQRVVRHLLDLTQDGPDAQVLAVRQADIAHHLNVTREAVAAALRGLREAGLVETGYRAIALPSVAKLRKLR